MLDAEGREPKGNLGLVRVWFHLLSTRRNPADCIARLLQTGADRVPGAAGRRLQLMDIGGMGPEDSVPLDTRAPATCVFRERPESTLMKG